MAKLTEKEIRAIAENMTDDALCGQVLCYDVYDKDDPEEVRKIVEKIKPGGLYVGQMSAEKIKMYTEMVNRVTPVPVIIAADIESGPGDVFAGEPMLPMPMAWGACNDEKLIERAGELIAEECRSKGIHWTFSPVVDINFNPNNPIVNIRAISDSPRTVARIGRAFVRGLKKDGLMATTCKHFPGDGVDDRNQHFCTTVNSLTKEEWDSSYGAVYRAMIEEGTDSIMVAHIALPAYQAENDAVFGPPPAVLSEEIMTGLLRGRLHFGGCIVSDAMSMIGSASRVPIEDLACTFLRCGGDMVLFPEPTDHAQIKESLLQGRLDRSRLVDAVVHVLKMKNSVHLFEEAPKIGAGNSRGEELRKICAQIAERSIKIVRDTQKILPLHLKKGAKILLLNEYSYYKPKTECDEFILLEEELKKRGFITRSVDGAKHSEIKDILPEYDCVLVNFKFSSRDYHGGSLRIGWDHIMLFWRAYLLQHPCVVFTSFGDPYKLYEFPYLKTYVNAFSFTPDTIRATVRVILGEIPCTAKNPVGLSGLFERETD